jgi:hypothetical protein
LPDRQECLSQTSPELEWINMFHLTGPMIVALAAGGKKLLDWLAKPGASSTMSNFTYRIAAIPRNEVRAYRLECPDAITASELYDTLSREPGFEQAARELACDTRQIMRDYPGCEVWCRNFRAAWHLTR